MDAGAPRFGDSRSAVMAHNSGVRSGSLIPQLFTSIPALGDAASYLSGTISNHCFRTTHLASLGYR